MEMHRLHSNRCAGGSVTVTIEQLLARARVGGWVFSDVEASMKESCWIMSDDMFVVHSRTWGRI